MLMAGKQPKLTGTAEVQQFLITLVHPLKEEIIALRELILNADATLSEHIKWKAPSFCHEGEDRITFHLHAKDHFKLIFHRGAKVKKDEVQGRLVEDSGALLEWAAPDRAVLKIGEMADVRDKSEAITALVKAWIQAAAT